MTAAVVAPAALTLPISEVFHNTIQGEGPAAGRPASFIRLMGCNLSCSWCDTPYTWDARRFNLRSETTHRTGEALAAEVAEHRAQIAVITGGEPLLHQNHPAFHALCDLLGKHEISIHVETNGTIAPSRHLVQAAEAIVVSPKLPHAGRHRGHQDPRMAEGWEPWPNVFLKVVCRGPEDVARAVEIAEAYGISRRRTYVMPEGRTAPDLGKRWPAIATAAAEHGVCASHRLHVLAWGDKRGH